MSSISTESLLKGIYEGKIVLPEFQRSFIWGTEDIKDLMSSILGGYYIGSMLTMDSVKIKEDYDCEFALRLFEGVKEVNAEVKMQNIVKVILDGQQRSTSLFYVIYEPEIPLSGRKFQYVFYLDIEKALREEWSDAVIAVSKGDKKRISEINSGVNELKFISFSQLWELVSDPFKYREKFYAVTKEQSNDEILKRLFLIGKNLRDYKIHLVEIEDKNPTKIVETFERINRTGQPLSVVDLVTARLYRDGIKLRDLIKEVTEEYDFISDVEPQAILKVIALLRGLEPKRSNLLKLDSSNFEEDFWKSCKLLETAFKRMTATTSNGYGIINFKKWCPYTPMIVTLAAELDKAKNEPDYRKIDTWYWISIFSQRYDQSVDSIIYSDYKNLSDWIENNNTPSFVNDFNPENVDLNISSQNNAIYRGVMNLVVLNGAFDFKTGQAPIFEPKKIQDDHIFPKSHFKDDSVLNRTLITSNQSKFNKRPSEYFREKLIEFGESKLKEILESHLIPFEALEFLLNDDIENFKKWRKEAIIEEIKKRIYFEN